MDKTASDNKPTEWHVLDQASALRLLDSSASGLTGAEAAQRLARHGPNTLPEAPRPGPLVRLARQFNNLLILVLIAAAVITLLLGHTIDTIVIMAVVLANTAIGYYQEGKAENALEALRDMLAPMASVWREGRRQACPGRDLVPGDVVWIESGDKVPADLRLLDVQGMTVEEAILTGESVPVRKATAPVAADVPLGDRACMAYSGTLVAEGSARGMVVATGAQTQIGQISGMLSQVQVLTTPLIRQTEVFARWLTGAILVVSGLFLLAGVTLRGTPFDELFMIVVGFFVAAIPEGLPAVLTVTLAIGVQSMARRNAIVRRLPIIETLGAVSVICSDKTGTLTRNEMSVATLATAEGRFSLTGDGLSPVGEVHLHGQPIEPGDHPTLARAARIAALCNSAHLHAVGPDGAEWRVEGDPMEGALLAMAARLGHTADRPDDLDTIPFDARTRYMAVLDDGLQGAGKGERFALVKGAPEQVLSRCHAVLAPGGPEPLDVQDWLRAADDIAADGQRVLALAQVPHATGSLTHDDLHDLVLVGLVGLIDPPRPEAITAVAECHSAGISVKMITGDHAATAAAIGRLIGLKRTGKVLTGADLDQLDDQGLRRAVLDTDVFARTSPEHKLRLVTALQADGQIVAMTGDGVNDAPALKRADAGIAMGLKGSQAAREASDFVLADDNFASIAEAVRQGRTVYANLKKVISFLLPVNGGESLSLLIAVALAITLPISPLQILWVNMVSSVVLAMVLAFEPPEKTIMQRPPRDPKAPMLSGFVVWRIVFVSVLFMLGIFGQFNLALAAGHDLDTARTMALNTLVAMEIFYLFSVRYMQGGSITRQGVQGTPAVVGAVAVVVALQALLTYLPLMNRVFETVPLTPLQLALCAAGGLAVLLVLEAEKALLRVLGRG